MSDPRAQCVQSDAAWSGAAALATLSAAHGIPLRTKELAALTATQDTAVIDEGMVLVMARALGLEAAAMEGGYGDLGDVVLPLVVQLRENGRDRYAVLFAFDGEGTQVGDPATGSVSRWTRERFCSRWTGSVVQATPIEEERRALAARLAELRDPVKRALRSVGWTAPYDPKVAMLALAYATVAVAIAAPHETPFDAAWLALVAAAGVGSLWSWLGAGSCAQCHRAKQLAGALSLAPLGAALYAGLLASSVERAPQLATGLVIAAAAGAHVGLVTALARARVACAACLVVAACALGAGVVSIARGDAPVAPMAIAAVVAGGALFALLPSFRAREARVWRTTAESLARTVAEPPPEAGRVRVVAFKRAGCSMCAFFEAAVKPALLATFAESLTLEERELGDARTLAPVVMVLGAKRALFVGLPAEDAPAKVLDAVRAALESEARTGEVMAVHVAA